MNQLGNSGYNGRPAIDDEQLLSLSQDSDSDQVAE